MVGSHEVAGKGYVKTENNQMASIGVIFSSRYHNNYSGKVWHIDSFWAFGERKFGELIDQPIDYQL